MLTSNLLQHMLLLDFDVCISLMYQFKQYLGNVNKSEQVTVHSIIFLKYIFITTYSCVIIIPLLLTTISIEPTLHLLHSVTLFSFYFFSVRLLSVLRGHSIFSSSRQRPMTSDFGGFLYQILSITLFSCLNS